MRGAGVPGLQTPAAGDGGASDADVVLLGSEASVAMDRANVLEGIRRCP